MEYWRSPLCQSYSMVSACDVDVDRVQGTQSCSSCRSSSKLYGPCPYPNPHHSTCPCQWPPPFLLPYGHGQPPWSIELLRPLMRAGPPDPPSPIPARPAGGPGPPTPPPGPPWARPLLFPTAPGQLAGWGPSLQSWTLMGPV
jgi:hypothetical protein